MKSRKIDSAGKEYLHAFGTTLLMTSRLAIQTQTLILKVGPNDATLLFGTRDSVPMEHCSTLSQDVVSASNNVR